MPFGFFISNFWAAELLKTNVNRHKHALQRERENQKRQREAEQARRGQGGY
jgi:hypothetical protein